MRVCDEKMGVTALGLVNRGFVTVVSPEFRQSLDSSRCIACGQCAALCPTGALEPKTPFRKSVPLDTKVTKSFCTGCANLCPLAVHTCGSSIIRCEPGEEDTVLCKTGAFGFAPLNNPARLTVCSVDGNEATREAALAALAERIKGGAVLLNANLSREAIDAALSFAEANGAAAYSFFEATDCDAERRLFGADRDQGANAAYLASLGVKPYGGEACGAFAVFGGGAIVPNGELVGYEGIEPRDAAILLAYQTPFETVGTFTKPDGSTVQTTPSI